MSDINIPKRFREKLESDTELDGVVKTTLAAFGQIYAENNLYFFPEYTDHGSKHIENVLQSSDNLISQRTYDEVLGSKDIGYYILAVILHDIGMHLTLDGFDLLLNGAFDDVRVEEFDRCSWSFLFNEYLDEAKKFNGKQLQSIFGDEKVIVRIPPLSSRGEINENDKKLIGEFIRRNHTRLAHEIAIKAFPGQPSMLEFGVGLSLDVKNLIGVISRSHGLDLRQSTDYLENKFTKKGRNYPFNTHAAYLMVVLRISDYIQIDKTRTNANLKLKTFSSPISELEHKAHLAIDFIDDKYQEDPERIFVTASPKDSIMYLKLKNLIKEIQYEFDISWAVLGELYGNYSNKPEIKYRRITSNLEDAKFIESQEYIADTFSFKASDEIIKLLIAPLYSDDPKYGVRELLQNSIDACKEREELEIKNSVFSFNSIITVEISDTEEPFFTIIDNGVGMDSDVIKNYLLNAGASYRKSFDWQKEFQNEKGDSVIRRSGRFGVGLLAAFLIGDEIYVETKKLGHKTGYKFSANLNTDQINIIKEENIPTGTIIKIKIKKEALKFKPIEDIYGSTLQWFQWFTLIAPNIKFIYFNENLIPYKSLDPDVDNIPIDWNSIDPPKFNKILWTYSDKYALPKFTCNGIVVPQTEYHMENILDKRLIRKIPKLSIFDNNAYTPISLDRNSFSGRLPFEKELITDIYKDYLAYILVFDKISVVNDNWIYLKNNDLEYSGLNLGFSNFEFRYGSNIYDQTKFIENLLSDFLDRILISKKGFIIDYNFFIRKIKNLEAIFIQSTEATILETPIELDLGNRFLSFTDSRLFAVPDYIRAISPQETNWNTGYQNLFGSRIFMKDERYNYIYDVSKKRIAKWLYDQSNLQFQKQGWTCLHLNSPIPSIISDHFLKHNFDKINFIREYEIKCYKEGDEILNGLLQKYLGDDIIIPFEIEARKNKYPLAFKELDRYMQKYLILPKA